MMEDTDWRPSPCPHCGEFREASRNPICKNPKCAASSSRHTSSTTAVDMSEEITRLRARLAAAEANCDAELTAALMAAQERHKADKLAAMARVREAALRLIDLLSLGRSHSAHKAMVKAIRALDLDALAEGEK